MVTLVLQARIRKRLDYKVKHVVVGYVRYLLLDITAESGDQLRFQAMPKVGSNMPAFRPLTGFVMKFPTSSGAGFCRA